jgi:hypothetical protein
MWRGFKIIEEVNEEMVWVRLASILLITVLLRRSMIMSIREYNDFIDAKD